MRKPRPYESQGAKVVPESQGAKVVPESQGAKVVRESQGTRLIVPSLVLHIPEQVSANR